MKVIRISSISTTQKAAEIAADVMKNNGIVVYPTDTAYGLGVNAFDESSLLKMYKAKRRSLAKPTHVVVRNWKMIENISVTNDFAKVLFKKFMPGALTLILEKKNIIPNIISSKDQGIGMRIPSHIFTNELSKLAVFPYTTSSANRTGETTPYSIEDVKRVLDLSSVDLLIDAGQLPHKATSTIIDVRNNQVNILRDGSISSNELLQALKR